MRRQKTDEAMVVERTKALSALINNQPCIIVTYPQALEESVPPVKSLQTEQIRLRTDEQIEEFCRLNHGVTFPLMKKTEVNGEDAHPVYKWLKSQAGFAGFNPEHPLTKILDEMFTKADPDYASKPDIKWNFTKFLISKEGRVVSRFEPTTEPQDMEKSIEQELSK